MPKKKERVIIDTNLWIHFLLASDSLKLDKLFAEKLLTLLFSQTLLEEFIEVAQRPKFEKYISPADLEELIIQIQQRAEFIEVISHVSICRDPKDNFLLSLSRDGMATHLVTGDKDLLDIKKFGKTRIVTITKYLSKK